MNELIRLKTLVEVRQNGRLITRGPNVITLAGKNLVAERLQANDEDFITHMACGDSGTAAAESQTDLLGTEHERVTVTPSVVDETLSFAATFGAGFAVPIVIQEFGLFNDAAIGVMFSRFVTPVINGDTGDEIDVTWSLSFL